MGPVDHDLARLLDTARAAHQRGDWDTSYRCLREAQRRGTSRPTEASPTEASPTEASPTEALPTEALPTEALPTEALPTEALSDLALAAWWLGFTSETLALTEEVHRRFLAEGTVDRAVLHAVDLAMIWLLRGDMAIGSGWLSRARRLLSDRPESPAHGLVRYVDVSVALVENDLETAYHGARDLQRLGEQLSSPTLSSLGLTVEGVVHVRQGRVREGFALLDEAMLPIVAGEVLPEWAGSVYCHIMSTCYDLVDVRRARQWTEATERWCAQFSGAVMFLGICRVHRVQLLHLEGAWAQAEREARRVCADLADMNSEVVAESHYQLGEVQRVRGDVDAAREEFRKAAQLGHPAEPGASLLCLARGELGEASARIGSALADTAADVFQRARVLRALVEIALSCGQPDGATQAAAELEAIAARYDSPGFRVWSDHARGAVLLRQGRAREALPLLTAACREYQEMRAPYDQAATHRLLADGCRAVGDVSGAEAHDKRAAAILHRLGVPVDAHAPGRARSHPGGLTDRELEVLAAIAAGASNRQVASTLSITEKTVGRHLSNIFTKLGVGSRTAAASWAHEHGVARGGAG